MDILAPHRAFAWYDYWNSRFCQSRDITRLNDPLKRAPIFLLDFSTGLSGAGHDSIRKKRKALPLVVMFDIAFHILMQAEDFVALQNMILVNTVFFNAYSAYRAMIIRNVGMNMYDETLLDYALVLAPIGKDHREFKPKNSAIRLKPEDSTGVSWSQSIIRQLQFIYNVMRKWTDLYERGSLWVKPGNAGLLNLEKLENSERLRFSRGLLLYWIYSSCTGDSIEGHAFSISVGAFDDAVDHVFDYFSNFEIAEMMAIYKFFDTVLHATLVEHAPNATLYPYLHGKSPYWFLELLHKPKSEPWPTSSRQDGGRMEEYMSAPSRRRGFDFMTLSEHHLTVRGHQELVDNWEKIGMNGNFRPSDKA